MRALRISIHSFFAVLGGILILNTALTDELKNIFLYVLMGYILGFLLFSLIREIYLLSFPRYLGLLFVLGFYTYQFISRNYIIDNQEYVQGFIIAISTILAFYFSVNAIIGIPISLKFKKIKTTSFKKYYRISSFFWLFIIVSIFAVFMAFKNDVDKISSYIIAILIIPLPYFNKNFIKGFITKINEITTKFDWNISIDQIGKLAKIKNFVFVKDKFISSGFYQMVDSDYRSTIKVMSVMQLANQLANEWNKKYARLFILDDYERGRITYNIVEQNEDGITVIDDYAVMYHFGNNSYMKDKIKKDESSNLFLVKNGLPIAKFKINEKIADDRAQLINQLDFFGNTIFFNPGMKEDLGRDYFIVFDKVYSGINEKRQQELLNELEKKAPTAFISAKNLSSAKKTIGFYITSKINVENMDNQIVCQPDKILMIPQLIKLSKKVHTFLKYSLLISVTLQFLGLLLAVLNDDKKILILGIYLSISILVELSSEFFKKKLIYLPDQPANLDHSHQAE